MLAFLLAGALRATAGEDMLVESVYKGQVFSQVNGVTFVATNQAYLFQASAVPLALDSNVNVRAPGGVTNNLTLVGGTEYDLNVGTVSQSALDAAFGTGSYTVHYTGPDDGSVSDSISLGADQFPPAPSVADIAAAQDVNPTNDFAVTFAPWAGASPSNYVELTVSDNMGNQVFATEPIYLGVAENATNTSITIPGGTLNAGQAYNCVLRFTGLTTANYATYPALQAGFFSETTFTLQTIGGGSTEPPVSLAPPTGFTNSFVTLMATNGTGSLTSNGVMQIFTSVIGTNYYVLGSAGVPFGGGGYLYTVTGTNTASFACADGQEGNFTLALTFTAQNAGTYLLTYGASHQTGTFAATLGYASVLIPGLFNAGLTNGQFQAVFSGQPGIGYSVQVSTNLQTWTTWSNFTMADLTTNLVDPAPRTTRRFYRPGSTAVAFAPASLVNDCLDMNVLGGGAPMAADGSSQWAAAATGSSYQIHTPAGLTNGLGNYSYSVTGSSGTVTYTDTSSSKTYTLALYFTGTQNGYFQLTQNGGSGFQWGSFTLAQGPTVFFGGVRFSPATSLGASISVPANGPAMSLSVTDSFGYAWTMAIPTNALLSPAVMTLTPMMNIDPNGTAVPIKSGVQVGPPGITIVGGVKITVKPPSPFDTNAVMVTGGFNGDDEEPSESTAGPDDIDLSTGIWEPGTVGVSDPPAVPPGISGEEAAAESATIAAATTVANKQDLPPIPPDDERLCNGNPAGDQAVSDYLHLLFADDQQQIDALLEEAATRQWTGNNTNEAQNLIEDARQVVETDEYRKVNQLLYEWKNDPFKMKALETVTLFVEQQDLVVGGSGGQSGWNSQLVNLMVQVEFPYYVGLVRAAHEYDRYNVLMSIKSLVDALDGAANDDFMNTSISNAYVFNCVITVVDTACDHANASGGTCTLSALDTGSLTPTLGELEIYDICTFNYTSGNDGGNQLILPLQYGSYVTMMIDDCENTCSIDFFPGLGGEEVYQDESGTYNWNYLSADCNDVFAAQLQSDGDEFFFPNNPLTGAETTITLQGTGTECESITITLKLTHTPR